MLTPPPYENDLFDSADTLRNACVDFAKREGYVVNQQGLDKKRGWLRLKYARRTTTKQGGGGIGLRQVQQITGCPSRITAWKNGDGG